MIPLLLDQGLPRSAARLLRQGGWDVLHAGECGLSVATDPAILAFAASDGRVVCTLDADFHALLAMTNAGTPSVIRIRREGMRGIDIAALLTAVWPEIEPVLVKGAVITITTRAIRYRHLPLLGPRNPSG